MRPYRGESVRKGKNSVTKDSTPAGPAAPAAVNPWSDPTRGGAFLANDEVRRLRDRALDYARAGVPVHFCGPAGLGKTAIAFNVAEALGREIALMTGNSWLVASDFIGGSIGNTSSTVIDRYIQSVQRTEKQTRNDWGASILVQAMVRGQTLIYDEFTRATPQANATLLSVLEEGLLICTDPSGPQRYVRAHPNFRVLLTSNPQDYVAVNAAPDALLDRVVTLRMEGYSIETMAQIVVQRTFLADDLALQLVQMVASFHRGKEKPGFSILRTALLAGRVAAHRARADTLSQSDLSNIVTDILTGRGVDMRPSYPATGAPQFAAE